MSAPDGDQRAVTRFRMMRALFGGKSVPRIAPRGFVFRPGLGLGEHHVIFAHFGPFPKGVIPGCNTTTLRRIACSELGQFGLTTIAHPNHSILAGSEQGEDTCK